MTATPEQAKADAVRELIEIREAREELDRRIKPAVLRARAVGVPVRRVAEAAGISPDTVNRWTKEATTPHQQEDTDT